MALDRARTGARSIVERLFRHNSTTKDTVARVPGCGIAGRRITDQAAPNVYSRESGRPRSGSEAGRRARSRTGASSRKKPVGRRWARETAGCRQRPCIRKRWLQRDSGGTCEVPEREVGTALRCGHRSDQHRRAYRCRWVWTPCSAGGLRRQRRQRSGLCGSRRLHRSRWHAGQPARLVGDARRRSGRRHRADWQTVLSQTEPDQGATR